MKFELPDELSSKQDLKALILEIRGYARWLAQAAVKGRYTNGQAQAPPVLTPRTSELISRWNNQSSTEQSHQTITPKSLDELLAMLDEYTATAPTITITLAAAPPKQLKEALINWCRKNIGRNILVDFKFNSTMLGGIMVAYGSRVYDWSFKRQILSARSKFPGMLRNV